MRPASFQPLLRLLPLYSLYHLQPSENTFHRSTMEMAQQISNALTSMSRVLALHGQHALRTSSQPVTSHQNLVELMNGVLRILDEFVRQVEVLRTETLKVQPHRRPCSDPDPSSEVDDTSSSTSPGSSHDALASTEVITGNAPSRSRTRAVAVEACSSRPRPSTSQYQYTERRFPDQNQRHGPSGMLNASTATIRRSFQSPRSSIEAGPQDNVVVDIRASNTGDSSSHGENSTFDHGESSMSNRDGNVVSDARERSGSDGIDSSNVGGSRRSSARIGARATHHVDRVGRSNVRGGRIPEEVRISTGRPQQHRSVRPASPAAFLSSPQPRTLRGVASGRALNGSSRSYGSYTERIQEYRIHKAKKNPLLRRPLVVNGSVPTYV